MSYKNDHMLVIANKYGKASMDAKADMFEAYDQLRDLTVSGESLDGSGLGVAGGFLMNLARLISPGAFMPILGSNSVMNIPGTSYSSPISGGNAITPTGTSAFGLGSLGNRTGYPSGAAASISNIGKTVLGGVGSLFGTLNDEFNLSGMPTGAASSLSNMTPAAGAVTGVSGAVFPRANSIVLPVAGVIAGIGSLASSLGPYFGPFGMAAALAGNLANGYGGAVLNSYQTVTSRIVNNADIILSSKIKNVETVVKQLDAQGDVVRKMLKEGVDADSKALQNLT